MAPDLLGLIRQDGLDRVQGSLEAWLTETSQLGTGDVTLGLICGLDALGQPEQER
jgi:hypothetical protein